MIGECFPGGLSGISKPGSLSGGSRISIRGLRAGTRPQGTAAFEALRLDCHVMFAPHFLKDLDRSATVRVLSLASREPESGSAICFAPGSREASGFGQSCQLLTVAP